MIQVGFKSDKGIRRENNEDACFVVASDNVYIVADGVGGNNAGEIASRTAVSIVAEYIRENPVRDAADEEELRNYFMACLNKTNREIYALARRHAENRGMATTMVIAYLTETYGYIVNVGDSRAYLCRDGQMCLLTEDHTYVNELLKKGIITEEEALHHPKRNMITRAVGGDAVIEPDFFRIDVQEGDIMLLCTDGLYSEVPPDTMARLLADAGSMREAAAALVCEANRLGGRDNITVVCLKI